ncbi:sortase-dependent protein [Streptomyces fumanus]|uniref:sortase-dependent protein n=1 Tax=Streptomyces fumanus TaxID=67302 RepID=UPI0033D9EDF2
MRRTILSAVTLTGAALLAGAAPAFADGPSPVPSAVPASDAPSPGTEPTEVPSPVATAPTEAPSPVAEGQVSVVPEGAPDTGVAEDGSSGPGAGLIGAGSGAALAAGGAALVAVRRRRAAAGA